MTDTPEDPVAWARETVTEHDRRHADLPPKSRDFVVTAALSLGALRALLARLDAAEREKSESAAVCLRYIEAKIEADDLRLKAEADRDEYRREWESACELDRAANALRIEAERERDLARGAMAAQDANHRQQLMEHGLAERFPSLTHLADEMGEALLTTEAERERLHQRLEEIADAIGGEGGGQAAGSTAAVLNIIDERDAARAAFGRCAHCKLNHGSDGVCVTVCAPCRSTAEADAAALRAALDEAWRFRNQSVRLRHALARVDEARALALAREDLTAPLEPPPSESLVRESLGLPAIAAMAEPARDVGGDGTRS